jgi:hypothetical protein
MSSSKIRSRRSWSCLAGSTSTNPPGGAISGAFRRFRVLSASRDVAQTLTAGSAFIHVELLAGVDVAGICERAVGVGGRAQPPPISDAEPPKAGHEHVLCGQAAAAQHAVRDSGDEALTAGSVRILMARVIARAPLRRVEAPEPDDVVAGDRSPTATVAERGIEGADHLGLQGTGQPSAETSRRASSLATLPSTVQAASGEITAPRAASLHAGGRRKSRSRDRSSPENSCTATRLRSSAAAARRTLSSRPRLARTESTSAAARRRTCS